MLKQILRSIQPASLAPFERQGVDLFADRFPVHLYGEGTVRGTGGLRIIDEHCQTDVPGLYAAGDAATRELVAGATSGGGAQNSAWALTSGRTAGLAAAARARARQDGRRAGDAVRATGRAGLRPNGSPRAIDGAALLGAVQDETIGFDKALSRDGTKLAAGRDVLEQAWQELAAHGHADGLAQVASRELAAMAATARWVVAAALARDESRGMHMRTDRPDLAPGLGQRLLTGGLDTVWTRYETAVAAPAEIAA